MVTSCEFCLILKKTFFTEHLQANTSLIIIMRHDLKLCGLWLERRKQ